MELQFELELAQEQLFIRFLGLSHVLDVFALYLIL